MVQKLKNSGQADNPPANNNVSDETILKISKEISIKFIEVGRITPATFEQSFKNIFNAIDNTVNKG